MAKIQSPCIDCKTYHNCSEICQDLEELLLNINKGIVNLFDPRKVSHKKILLRDSEHLSDEEIREAVTFQYFFRNNRNRE